MMRALVAALVLVGATGPAGGQPPPGVAPQGFNRCPAEHPVKGYTTRNGTFVYYVPGGPGYDKAVPDRCFASEEQVRAAGYGSRPRRAAPGPQPLAGRRE